MINAEKSKITDEMLFRSSAFAAYLTDIAETASERYGRKIKVRTKYDTSEGAMLACTDNREILINTGNYLTRSFPSRPLKADSLIGLNAHEIGHILFTNFKVSETYFRCLSWGSVYPDFDDELTTEEEMNLQELIQFLQTDTDVRRAVVLKAAKHILNILEDAYIEARICEAFPGKFATGIHLNNIRFSELVPSIDEQLERGNSKFAVFTNLLVQYCTSGDINDRDNHKGDIMDRFMDVLPYVDAVIYDDDMKERCRGTNKILLNIWDYIKEITDEAKSEQDETGSTHSEAVKRMEEKLDGELIRFSEDPEGDDMPIPADAPVVKDMDKEEERKKEIQDVLEETGGRMPLLETDTFDEGEERGIEYDTTYKGMGYERSAEDISRILTSIAEEKVEEQLFEELEKELKDEADGILLGNAHKGIHIRINRMRDVDDDYIKRYEAVAPPLLAISKQMQKRMRRIMKDSAFTEKETGLLLGKRIEARLLSDRECRVFSRKRLPGDKKNLAVALLLDESGSMCFSDRATYARAAAIIVYDFCRAMDVPVLIMGHTEYSDVELYAYTDFDSTDMRDRYRLMDISARSENRDGAALRFVAERLMKQPEENKLLMLVSDGQPAASGGYMGTAAEADLRGIKQEFTNKGMIFVAAAIGSDKENIERIYGSSFLDITDLTQLPFLLVKKIERTLKG